MNPIVIFSVCLVLTTLSACSGRPATVEPTGKYQVSKSNNNDDGKYRPVKRNEGRYIHMVQPYVHVHDNRELGQYVHIPNPYDGGYGPYSGLNNPYRHDESGNYDKYTTTSTTTRRPTTTTTTTVRPRLFNYYEEGGWKILRQEEEKEKHKYDFLYHTENGIYGEEKAHLHPGAGTAASGYYEYTGDDGELYRVNYKSDHRGFVPEGDHIPTPPPVPDAIKRALEYVAKKKETHGQVQSGHYEHKPGPVRLQNMPTIDRPLSPQQPIQQLPKALPPLPTITPITPAQPRFIQYSGNNQYNALPTIAPQNAAQRAYQAPSLASRRPADQLIQQTQLAHQLPSDQLPQVQVLLPQVQVQKPAPLEPVQLVKPVEVVQQVQLPKLPELPKPTELPRLPVLETTPLPRVELKPQVQEEQPQSDQPQADQPQADQPQADQPQADQPQVDQPQVIEPQEKKPEQLPQEEIPSKEEQLNDQQLQPDQSIESVVYAMPDKAPIESKIEEVSKVQESAAASEQENSFQPPYQVPEKLKDEENFELTTA